MTSSFELIRLWKVMGTKVRFAGVAVVLGCVVFVAGCTATRLVPRDDLSKPGPVHVVIKKLEGPIESTFKPSTASAAYAFLYGFSPGIIVTFVFDSEVERRRALEAERQIQPIRKIITRDVLHAILARSFVESPNAELRFDTASIVERSNSDQEMRNEDLIRPDGVTLIVTPAIALSPNMNALLFHTTGTGYAGTDNKRVYHGEVECQIFLLDHPHASQAALTWLTGEKPFLQTQIERCAAANARVFASEMYQRPNAIGLIPPRKRERKLNPNEDVQVGAIGEFKLYEKPTLGHYMIDMIQPMQRPPAVELVDGKLTVLEESTLVARIHSSDLVQVEKTAELINAQFQYGSTVLDAIAARAWAGAGTYNLWEGDVVALLTETLGKSGNPRYRKILKKIRERATHRRIQRYTDIAIARLSLDEVEQFFPGDQDATKN